MVVCPFYERSILRHGGRDSIMTTKRILPIDKAGPHNARYLPFDLPLLSLITIKAEMHNITLTIQNDGGK